MYAGPTSEWSRYMKASKNKIEREFAFHPERMRRIPPDKRHRVSREETALRNCKVRVTMYVDADVVEYFKRRSAGPNAAPYQTQINSALRTFVAGASSAGDYAPLLRDERFLDAVAERVRARVK